MPNIEIFFRDCLARLKQIVSRSNGDVSIDDVKNEAWVMDHDSASAGRYLDLSLSSDQEAMLGKLYGKFVLNLRTRIGLALRLDKNWDAAGSDDGPLLAERIAAPLQSDPLMALELREVPDPLDVIRHHSYSQATAYAICLDKWPTREALAEFLGIKLYTLMARVRFWRRWIKYQESLFDGIEHISRDFTPLERQVISAAPLRYLEGDQHAWAF